MYRIFASLVVACTLLLGVISFTSTAQKPVRLSSPNIEAEQQTVESAVAVQKSDHDNSLTTLRAFAGHITKTEVESPQSFDLIKVVNNSGGFADVDLMALDNEGNEVGRETVTVEPKLEKLFNLQNIFPDLSFNDVSVIEVQSSVRPIDSESVTHKYQTLGIAAAQLPIAFFSQRNSLWSGNQLGTCNTTIGKQGC